MSHEARSHRVVAFDLAAGVSICVIPKGLRHFEEAGVLYDANSLLQLGDLFAAHDAREERRAKRARQKAERKQRRDEALRGQPASSTNNNNGGTAVAEEEAGPSPNDDMHGFEGRGPSTTEEFADEYLAIIQDWLHGRLAPPSGDA